MKGDQRFLSETLDMTRLIKPYGKSFEDMDGLTILNSVPINKKASTKDLPF